LEIGLIRNKFYFLLRNMVRALLSDGWNSVFHVGFGAVAGAFAPLIGTGVFSLYQFQDMNDPNILTDFAEFGVGFFLVQVIAAREKFS
jgi:hypothetical protein